MEKTVFKKKRMGEENQAIIRALNTYSKLYAKNKELEQRIDKAIEYIKRYNMLSSGSWDATQIPDELLKILKGESNE